MGRRRWRERLCGSGRGEIERSGEERPEQRVTGLGFARLCSRREEEEGNRENG